MKNYFLLLILQFFMWSCATQSNHGNTNELKKIDVSNNSNTRFENNSTEASQINDTVFVNIKNYSKDFVFDMRYATTDNFLKAKVYDCAECFLRLKTVNALVKANKMFLKKGYRIKLYDCYRPLDIQKRMWTIVPNATYVANPAKGSIHNRGGAVDISLVDSNGKELDMGTTFDFFGKEAAHAYTDLSKKIIKNRLLLKNVMIKNNFTAIETEWWHYNYIDAKKDKVSNFKWDCD